MSNSEPTEAFVSFTTYETRQQYLLRTGNATPRFLQGVYPFVGRGVFELSPLHDALIYTIPEGKSAQILYVRAGNLSDDLLYLTLSVNSTPVRYFPVGPKSDVHVPLAIIETYPAGTVIAVCLAAPGGLSGSIVVDVGMIEIEAEDGRS